MHQEALVQPAVDMESLEQVMVLLNYDLDELGEDQ